MSTTFADHGPTFGDWGALFGSEASAAARTGGNLTKPRLHQGNVPGRKIINGSGQLEFSLILYGVEEVELEQALGLRIATGGQAETVCQLPFVLAQSHQGQIRLLGGLPLALTMVPCGTVADGDDDEDLLLILGDLP